MNNERTSFETFLLALGIALSITAVVVLVCITGVWLWKKFIKYKSNQVKSKQDHLV